MRHVDYFIEYFEIHKRGTARQISDFMISKGASFNCDINRSYTSVNRYISRECGKRYPTGVVCRENNANGIYEYFTK